MDTSDHPDVRASQNSEDRPNDGFDDINWHREESRSNDLSLAHVTAPFAAVKDRADAWVVDWFGPAPDPNSKYNSERMYKPEDAAIVVFIVGGLIAGAVYGAKKLADLRQRP